MATTSILEREPAPDKVFATMGLLELLGGVGDVLDTPGRFARTALAGRNPLASVFDPSQGVSGRDLLQHYGLVGENADQGWVPDAGDVGGFLAEMALDPTNLIGSGLLAKVMGKASKAKAANQGIEAANKLSLTQRLQGFMPEEIAKKTKITERVMGPVPEADRKLIAIAEREGNVRLAESLKAPYMTERPKRMYHGTASVFDKYDMDKADPNALYGRGIYNTDSPHVASTYTKKEASGRYPEIDELKEYFKPGNVVPSYGGGKDKVLEFMEGGPAGWKVRVQAVDKFGNPLKEPPRIHSTAPTFPDPEHVRMQFIDARNPLNMDSPLGDNFDKLGPLLKQEIERLNSGRMADEINWRASDIDKHLTGSDARRILGESGADPNAILKNAGFDAITHVGGRNTGGIEHNVAIALDPSQVYLPYIAKQIQELQKVPNAKPLLAALLGHNVMARFGGQHN